MTTTEAIRPEAFPHSRPSVEPDWLVAELEKAQAEQLLDWLENHGYKKRGVSASADGRFVVRYRPRPDSAP